MDFPTQQQAAAPVSISSSWNGGQFDVRDYLNPRRLTIAMWDQAFLLRHCAGESFYDWDRVLDEAVERGYNTLRIDPMPQTVDLSDPDRELTWQDQQKPFFPWGWQRQITCPAGRWLLEFLQKVAQRDLRLTLSAWWFRDSTFPASTISPRSTTEGAELWAKMLRVIKREVGFENVVYVDYGNEMPFFFPDLAQQLHAFEPSTNGHAEYTFAQKQWLIDTLDKPLNALQAEFPELRFTHSIHGNPRWLSVGLRSLDCLDVHFYADADDRWHIRTHFVDLIQDGAMFVDSSRYKNFSDRCAVTHRSVGPMLRARQRNLMRQFSEWAVSQGMPLTCSEGWSSWFYIDHPDLDWGWLIEHSKQAIDDAIELGFWGVTLNNYSQPQFNLWDNVQYHRQLNEKFLSS